MARSWEFEPNTRSTRGGGPVDLAASPGRGPRRRARRTPTALHSVPMSSRFTKKSLVSVPGRSVSTPCVDCPVVGAEGPQAADEHRHLGRGQGQQVGPVEQQRSRAAACRRRAGSCGTRRPWARARRTTSTSVCSWVASVRPGRERARSRRGRRRVAACSTAAQPPSTIRSASETRFPPDCASLKSCWTRSRRRSTVASSAGSLTSQSFCGASRMRAPLAPPRLSVPRKRRRRRPRGGDQLGDRQARVEERALQRGDVVGVDQVVVDRRGPGPATAAARAPTGRGSATPDPCRGAAACTRPWRTRRRAGRGSRGSAGRSARRPGPSAARGRWSASSAAWRFDGIVGVGHGVGAGAVLRLPLLGAGRALGQLPLVAEQRLEEAVVPLGRAWASRRPRARW